MESDRTLAPPFTLRKPCFATVDPMRIDGNSLIAAQSSLHAQRTQQAAPPAAQPQAKPLFEPLNFPKIEELPGPSKTAAPAGQTAARRVGAQLDITV